MTPLDGRLKAHKPTAEHLAKEAKNGSRKLIPLDPNDRLASAGLIPVQ